MLKLFLKRVFYNLISILVIVSCTFVIMKTIPGDPFTDEKILSEEVLSAMKKHYNLDKPQHIQYFNYLLSICKWDFGPSLLSTHRTANTIIKECFPISAFIGLQALFFSIVTGIILGLSSAFTNNKLYSTILKILFSISLSIPVFVFAPLLQYFFSIKLNIFPISYFESWFHTILPTISIAIFPIVFIGSQIKNAAKSVINSDYVALARMKGLSEFQVFYKHVLKNSCMPVISYSGILAANILTGSLTVESVFGIPGLGKWFISSVVTRDYPVIIGLTTFYSIILIVTCTICDILALYLDPRLKARMNNF